MEDVCFGNVTLLHIYTYVGQAHVIVLGIADGVGVNGVTGNTEMEMK